LCGSDSAVTSGQLRRDSQGGFVPSKLSWIHSIGLFNFHTSVGDVPGGATTVTMRRMFTWRTMKLLCEARRNVLWAGTLCENGKGQFHPFFEHGPVRTTRSMELTMHRSVKPVTWTK
ncbi:hypothetical protein X777_09010, partial [Ooceraea biroi]